MADTQDRDCPNCGAATATNTPYSKDEWQVVACGSCPMVYLRNPPEYEALEEDFAWEKTYVAEDQARAKKRSFIKRLANSIRQWNYRRQGPVQDKYLRYLGPGHILDIGCGDVVRWRDPFIPSGIEISTQLQQRADAIMRPLGGRCLHAAGAEGVWEFDEGQFDSVMMHSYLEHEVQVEKILGGAFRCLKPGGKAFVRVPNFNAVNRRLSGRNWPGFRYPDHVNYFTVETLASVAKRAGFDFKLVNRHKIWLDDNIQALFIKPERAAA